MFLNEMNSKLYFLIQLVGDWPSAALAASLSLDDVIKKVYFPRFVTLSGPTGRSALVLFPPNVLTLWADRLRRHDGPSSASSLSPNRLSHLLSEVRLWNSLFLSLNLELQK